MSSLPELTTPWPSATVQVATPPASILNEATRHLCAGVYVDHKYCTTILRNVYFDRSRRLAPSYGFELLSVLVHARRAWLLDLGQHEAVTLIALASLDDRSIFVRCCGRHLGFLVRLTTCSPTP